MSGITAASTSVSLASNSIPLDSRPRHLGHAGVPLPIPILGPREHEQVKPLRTSSLGPMPVGKTYRQHLADHHVPDMTSQTVTDVAVGPVHLGVFAVPLAQGFCNWILARVVLATLFCAPPAWRGSVAHAPRIDWKFVISPSFFSRSS